MVTRANGGEHKAALGGFKAPVGRAADVDAIIPDFHSMLAGMRQQMEFAIKEQFAQVESSLASRLADRDARLAAADALIERLRGELHQLQDERDRAVDRLARLRELATEADGA